MIWIFFVKQSEIALLHNKKMEHVGLYELRKVLALEWLCLPEHLFSSIRLIDSK